MYQPAHFIERDAEALAALMRASPLATLVHPANGELAADLLPLEAERVGAGAGGWRLLGHVARANPLWQAADGQSVLVVFQGPQAYVTPTWYPSKARHGKAVPTWNYAMVQAHGRLRAIEDEAWLEAFVTRLTQRHEAGRTNPWHVGDAPADYLASMLRAIVGIEIEVTRLEGKFKLSQNRPEEDRVSVVAGLQEDAAAGLQQDAARTAEAMVEAERRREGPASGQA